jgi:multimeric flavodoxin WrbA
MKIIAISSSPSHGRNSDSMLDAFIEGIKSVDASIDIKKYYLDEVEIDQYRYENRKGPLPHEEQFAKLCAHIQDAGGLVVATPTYNFSVPSTLKNFIDRIRFFALDFDHMNRIGQPTGKLGHLKTYYLVSGGTPKWAQRILFFAFPPFWLRSVFLYYGAECMGAFYTGDTCACRNEKILKKCRLQGEKYAKALKKGKSHGLPERIFWRPPQAD